MNQRSQSRSAARLAAVQALYQKHMEGTALAKLLDEFHQHRLGREIEEGEQYADAEVDFFDDIVTGVDARGDEIDALVVSKLAEAGVPEPDKRVIVDQMPKGLFGVESRLVAQQLITGGNAGGGFGGNFLGSVGALGRGGSGSSAAGV